MKWKEQGPQWGWLAEGQIVTLMVRSRRLAKLDIVPTSFDPVGLDVEITARSSLECNQMRWATVIRPSMTLESHPTRPDAKGQPSPSLLQDR